MLPPISDLADYTLAACVMEPGIWRLVFDSSDGGSVIQHELFGVAHWRTSELRDSIGVMEIGLKAAPDGQLTYKIDTTCNEVIEVTCANVIETHIKR